MAAILCESLSKILKGGCEACGHVLTLPCRACGLATEELTKVCRSPFCLYLSVALGLNLPPVVFTGKSLLGGSAYGDDGDCSSVSNWMATNAVLCVINMAAAVYISAKVSYDPKEANVNDAPFVEASVMDHETKGEKPAAPTENTLLKKVMGQTITDTQSRSMGRVREILCYDPVVAVYILVGIFYMVWQTMGLGRTRLAAGCEGGLDDYLTQSIICGFLFITMGGMSFACSLCCLVR